MTSFRSSAFIRPYDTASRNHPYRIMQQTCAFWPRGCRASVDRGQHQQPECKRRSALISLCVVRARDYTNGSSRDARDRERGRDYDRDRGRDRGVDRDRDADRGRPRPRSRSRSADRDRGRSGSRGVGDVFRSAAPRAGSIDRVKERY